MAERLDPDAAGPRWRARPGSPWGPGAARHRGGVAVADCRAVPADAPVPVAAAVAIEMPVIGERARSVEDAAVDDAMDALFWRGLIPRS